MEPSLEKPVIDTNDMEAQAFDAEGNSRVKRVLENGEVFYGSDKEFAEEMTQRRENK